MSDDQTAKRKAILEATLTHVVFDGWTQQALKAAGEDLGLEPMELQRHFPRGSADAIAFFSREADKAMLEKLADTDLSSMRIRDKVATAVKLRLEAVAAHKEAVRRGLTFFALPTNTPLALTCLYKTVDAIWQGIGDRSTDYNFYSKRLLLSAVFSATLVYWLDDKSEDNKAAWSFLDRRIDEVMKVGGKFGKTVGKILDLPDRLFAARGRGKFGKRPAH